MLQLVIFYLIILNNVMFEVLQVLLVDNYPEEIQYIHQIYI
jgi:hypothetical protein